jgi:multicomponent Na+:H+ antiporter subunit D
MQLLPVEPTNPIIVLLIGGIATPILGYLAGKAGIRRVSEAVSISFLMFSLFLLYPVYTTVEDRGIQVVSLFGEYPPPMGACFEIDMFSVFMAVVFVVLGILSAVYSVRYMERDTGLTEYYSLLTIMVAGMVGVVFAGDFFTFFVFWEIMCITSYVLVAFRKGRWEPIEAGFKYIIMSSAGTATILLAMSFLYGMTGTLNFAYIAHGLKSGTVNSASNIWIMVSLALGVVGFGVKAAIAPFHTWLPDAHPAAPSPVSSMLSGVVVKNGVYGLIRVILLIFTSISFLWKPLLMLLAVATMFTGNIMALLQKDIKRLLAFSTIAQIGYIIFGLSIGSFFGLTGSILHILNHAIMKGLLFMCAGAFIYKVGSRDLDVLTGIGKRMRASGAIFTVGALAIAGMPGLNGFVSELYIILAGIDAEMYLPTALMIFNVLFSVAYYLRMIQIIMLREPSESVAEVGEAPLSMLVPMGVMVALIVIIGVYPDPFLSFSSNAADAVLNISDYISRIVGGVI